MNEKIKNEDLPKKVITFFLCYRREIDERLRRGAHQFA